MATVQNQRPLAQIKAEILEFGRLYPAYYSLLDLARQPSADPKRLTIFNRKVLFELIDMGAEDLAPAIIVKGERIIEHANLIKENKIPFAFHKTALLLEWLASD